MSKCHEKWNKERSSLHLRQLEEALRCAVKALGNNGWQGKVFSSWLSRAWGLRDMKLSQAIINTPATCTRWDYWSQGQSLSVWGAPHPMAQTSLFITMHHTSHCSTAPSVYMDAPLSWTSLHTKPGVSYCCLHQKLKENRSHDGKNTMPWWGAGPQHPVCAMWTSRLYLLGREDSWRYLKYLKPSDRVVACCADRSQHVDMTCITTAKRFPKRKEKASILSAGLTLL